jgi:hypothetical protein
MDLSVRAVLPWLAAGLLPVPATNGVVELKAGLTLERTIAAGGEDRYVVRAFPQQLVTVTVEQGQADLLIDVEGLGGFDSLDYGSETATFSAPSDRAGVKVRVNSLTGTLTHYRIQRSQGAASAK